jgi:hypothetical protein
MKVFVYFNLHKKVFSVKALEGPNKGRVVAHRAQVLLVNAKFKVSEAGRQRVIREQRKNVHAGVVGEWKDTVPAEFQGKSVTYNPYKYNTFVYKLTEQPITFSPSAFLFDRMILVDTN